MELCLAAEQRPGPRVSRQWWEQDEVNVEGIWTADREVEQTEGWGDGWEGDRNGQIIRWGYTVANLILGTEPNYTLAYAPGLELHHPIVSIIGGNGGRLYK